MIVHYPNSLCVQTMAWILDEYSKFHGHSPAVVTGKPIVSISYHKRLKNSYSIPSETIILFLLFVLPIRILGVHLEGSRQLDLEWFLQQKLYLLSMGSQFQA